MTQPEGKGRIYGTRAYKLCEKFIEQLMGWHREALKFGQTSQWLAGNIEKYVYENNTYKRLSDRQKEAFSTIRMVMFREWQRQHIWTHVINGKRVSQGHPSVEGNYDQLNVPLAESISFHCQGYLIPNEGNRIVWIPVNQNEIDIDVAAGRLMQDHIDMVRSSAANKETPRLSMVYNHKLQVTVDLEQLTVPAWQIPDAA